MSRAMDLQSAKPASGFASAEEAVRRIAFGIESLDEQLRLPAARLHEMFAAEPGDAGAASAFALLMALRGRMEGKPLLWVSEERAARSLGRLYAPGVAELGGAPGDLLHVTAPDRLAALRAAADILRCDGVGAAIVTLAGEAPMPDLTASRRLTLAAEQNGVMAILLRIASKPSPSAAYSRWQVKAAPSVPLEAGAPGFPTFDLKLLRHRGGIAGFDVRLEWNRDQACFREPAPSGALVPLPGRGPAGDRPVRRVA